jgi:hypothetical protein
MNSSLSRRPTTIHFSRNVGDKFFSLEGQIVDSFVNPHKLLISRTNEIRAIRLKVQKEGAVLAGDLSLLMPKLQARVSVPLVEELESYLCIIEPVLGTTKTLPTLPGNFALVVEGSLLAVVYEDEGRPRKHPLEVFVDNLDRLWFFVVKGMTFSESVDYHEIVPNLARIFKQNGVVGVNGGDREGREEEKVEALLWGIFNELDAAFDKIPWGIKLYIKDLACRYWESKETPSTRYRRSHLPSDGALSD